MQKLAAALALSFLVTLSLFWQVGCSQGRQDQIEQTVGQFSLAEQTRMLLQPSSSFKVLIFTTPSQTATVQKKLSSLGGRVRIADNQSGIIIAQLTGKAALQLQRQNRAEAQAFARHLSIERRMHVEFSREKLNPIDGGELDANKVLIDPTVDAHQMPTVETGVFDLEAKLLKEYGIAVNGDTQTIAILDTGVDIARTDVFQNRIVQVRDFTKEGTVQLEASKISEDETSVSFNEKSFKIGTKMASDTKGYYIGSFKESAFGDEDDSISDINQDGDSKDEFVVLLSENAGSTKVAIDTNLDASFEDEVVLTNYASSFATTKMDSIGRVKLGINVHEKSDDGYTVDVAGFDGGQHGTHVAGIAAGLFTAPQFGKHFRGGAPAAKLMALKVLGANGGTDSDILEAAVFAAKNGATTFNLSLGSLKRPSDGLDALAEGLDLLARAHDVLFLISAGNSGPGMNTVGSPGTSYSAIAVGAAVTGATLRSAYGISNARDGYYMWDFSSRGPTDASEVRPILVAPGTAYSSVPLARSKDPKNNSGYDVYSGTSMAAPSAAGALTALRDAALKLKTAGVAIATDAFSIKAAAIAGAVSLNQLNATSGLPLRYNRFEEGAGHLNVLNSFEALKQRKVEISEVYEVETESLKDGYNEKARGAYTTSTLPDEVLFHVRKAPATIPTLDEHNFYRKFKLSSSNPWAQLATDEISLSGINFSDITVRLDREALRALPFGVHEARITAVNSENSQIEFYTDITYVKAREVDHLFDNSQFMQKNLHLEPGEVKRFMFFVTPDRSHVEFSLTTPEWLDENTQADFRMKMLVMDPTGSERLDSSVLSKANNKVRFSEFNPQPGVWEVIVTRKASAAGPSTSTLRMNADSVIANPKEWRDTLKANVSSKEFSITNYGPTIKPLYQVKADRLSATSANVELINEKNTEVEIQLPGEVRRIRVSTEMVKDNPKADIDLELYDSSGKVVGKSGGGNSKEHIEAVVKPGEKLKLVINAYDLNDAEKGQIDVALDFYLPSPVLGTATFDVSQLQLSWGKQAKVNASLDLSGIPVSMIDSLRATYGSLFAKGELRVFDGSPTLGKVVSLVPIELQY